MRTIVFFKNQTTQYDVLHDFRLSIMQALERQQFRTYLLELSSPDFLKILYSNPPDFTFAFNGLQPLNNGEFLSDQLEIPHIAWLVDAAPYFHDLAKSKFTLSICPDLESSELLTKWGAKHAYFLPHAFEAVYTEAPDLKRDIPLLFCGSLMDPIEIEALWKAHLPKNITNSFIEASENTLSRPELSYHNAFEEIVHAHPDFFTPLSSKQIADLATTLDRHIRAQDRIHLLQDFKGLPIHIYGNCLSKRHWGDFLDLSNGSYHIFPAVPFQTTLGLMKRAQIVLSSSPMFKTGGHERIFYGLGLGSAVLTNQTPWNEEHFSQDELLTYPSNNPSLVYDQIEELLKFPEKLVDIAERGQKKVLKEHTWDVRVRELIPILDKFTTEL